MHPEYVKSVFACLQSLIVCPCVYADGLPLIKSRTTQALGWEPVGIGALGPQYLDQNLCQENHLPASWPHIWRPPPPFPPSPLSLYLPYAA